ncbi:hypothetical protein EYF80_057980 [Liparis tanakae]|uniref:Uncharacterized protein n=1 Tax=Liparis tanakae TaxID=230148 RepID=A0A4Z2ETG5_9TELE|nr:hypothetical protein EYF80_057980 [Liparis tanakae]
MYFTFNTANTRVRGKGNTLRSPCGPARGEDGVGSERLVLTSLSRSYVGLQQLSPLLAASERDVCSRAQECHPEPRRVVQSSLEEFTSHKWGCEGTSGEPCAGRNCGEGCRCLPEKGSRTDDDPGAPASHAF